MTYLGVRPAVVFHLNAKLRGAANGGYQQFQAHSLNLSTTEVGEELLTRVMDVPGVGAPQCDAYSFYVVPATAFDAKTVITDIMGVIRAIAGELSVEYRQTPDAAHDHPVEAAIRELASAS